MKAKYQHFILTYYNVGIYEQTRYNPAEWMNERFKLFKKFCAPSIKAQTSKNFQWIIVFDPATPRDNINAITNITGVTVVPLIAKTPMRDRKKTAIQLRKLVDAEYLITSLLDNDDAIHRDYIRKIQKLFDDKEEAINFHNGYYWNLLTQKTRACSGEKTGNPFVTLIEKAEDINNIKTAWWEVHHEMNKIAPVRNIFCEPMWLMIEHGQNWAKQSKLITTIPIERIISDFGGGYEKI